MNPLLHKLKLSFISLGIYRDLLKDPIIRKLHTLLDLLMKEGFDLYKAIDLYNDFFFHLTSVSNGGSLKSYIMERIIFDDNYFSKIAENTPYEFIDASLLGTVKNDLRHLEFISKFSSSNIKKLFMNLPGLESFEKESLLSLPEWNLSFLSTAKEHSFFRDFHEEMYIKFGSQSWESLINDLSQFHYTWGQGIFAKYHAFLWKPVGKETLLLGVDTPDPIKLHDMIGYESERQEVIQNTLQFLKGFPANNMLLYGDRGTGKSSTVKAVVNEYFKEGLRLLEVSKAHLIDFPEIIQYLKGRKQKFILFVDDLSFEDNESSYNALKAVLEGGVESKPSNVIIYATSNRRHLIKEKFSDRAGLQSGNPEDEVRSADTLQEKLSLSDRFGITVVFSSPNKNTYLEIVEGMALKRGLTFDKEILIKEALKWELWYNGRSPRTARQFVDWLEGQQS